MWRLALGLVACSGCNALLGVHELAATDAAPVGDDASTDATIDASSDGGTRMSALHLADADAVPGTGSWTISAAITIDTTEINSSTPLPAGVTLDVRPQLGGGPELAVLHVDAFTIAAIGQLAIGGSRPFVVVAGSVITIVGTIDAGAHHQVPGAGGATTGAGNGGGAGIHDASGGDSGGGGGGFGTAGANGGTLQGPCGTGGGAGGSIYGDASIGVLVGGSAGGASNGSACAADPGGAGGGALQLTSATSIVIGDGGRVLAGGGGGLGGTDCNGPDANSGAGGGAGGAIVLQAPSITSSGILAANGGGGGGSSSIGAGTAPPGTDGQPNTQAAVGGVGPKATGGAGGANATGPTPGGGAACNNNAAGGGGAVGRIAVSTSFAVQGQGLASPPVSPTLPP